MEAQQTKKRRSVPSKGKCFEDQDGATSHPLQVAEKFIHLGERIQETYQTYPQQPETLLEINFHPLTSPLRILEAFSIAAAKLLEDPSPLLEATHSYYDEALLLFEHFWHPTELGSRDSRIPPPFFLTPDRRFQDPAWEAHPLFYTLKQSYLLWDRWIKNLADHIPNVDSQNARKITFYARQLSDALAPGNYFWSNPRAIQKLIETGGQSLLKGIENYLKDIAQGDGNLKISMVDREAFQVGKNIAMTPGKVIYQNELIQLIQYTPRTQTVFRIPLLLIPPCINKFYIYDLREDNSLVRWLVNRGHTVFMISWVNPDEKLAHKTFEDYVMEGVDQALSVVMDITQEKSVNTVGFCIGGNFLVALVAYYAAQSKRPNPFSSATYLATLFDFESAGDLKIFLDKECLEELEHQMDQKGYLDGRLLSQTFNLLRANDLIWSFVINNYLLGQDPMAFDLLFWNSDVTHLPAAMYGYYLRHLFFNNNLIKPGGITIRNVPLDLRHIKTPTYILSTKDDHIAPWPCGFAGKSFFAGPTDFILGGSGHIAGIFNPPHAQKYCYWSSQSSSKEAWSWLKTAEKHLGSWWEVWGQWLDPLGQDQVSARLPGHGKYPPLEEAPGSYVLEKRKQR